LKSFGHRISQNLLAEWKIMPLRISPHAHCGQNPRRPDAKVKGLAVAPPYADLSRTAKRRLRQLLSY
jgi:hypothetical protein